MIPSTVLTQIAAYLPTPSAISHHDGSCCRDVLAWLRGIDASNSFRNGRWYPPAWLRKEYDWGPHLWPVYWCNLTTMKKLDCGALAATATQLYRMRGQSVTPVQLALRYPNHVVDQWLQLWEQEGLIASWINREFCYHEACGVLDGNRVFLWDPTDNLWRDPPTSRSDGFASVVALKVSEPEPQSHTVYWNDIPIRCGVWQSFAFDSQAARQRPFIDVAQPG